jgi:hypothetical protein
MRFPAAKAMKSCGVSSDLVLFVATALGTWLLAEGS